MLRLWHYSPAYGTTTLAEVQSSALVICSAVESAFCSASGRDSKV